MFFATKKLYFLPHPPYNRVNRWAFRGSPPPYVMLWAEELSRLKCWTKNSFGLHSVMHTRYFALGVNLIQAHEIILPFNRWGPHMGLQHCRQSCSYQAVSSRSNIWAQGVGWWLVLSLLPKAGDGGWGIHCYFVVRKVGLMLVFELDLCTDPICELLTALHCTLQVSLVLKNTYDRHLTFCYS